MWSLGIPAALRDGPVGYRELRHNGEGSFLPEKQTNKKLALWHLSRMPFPCWTSTNKVRDKFPSPLTFSRNCPLIQFLTCPPAQSNKDYLANKGCCPRGLLFEIDAPQDRGLDFGGGRFGSGVGLSLNM